MKWRSGAEEVKGSQLGLVHAAHELLQLDGERHVSFDAELPRHEGHGRLQLPWNREHGRQHGGGASPCGDAVTELTRKHFGEVAGVHLHDDVSLDRRLPRPHAARAALQLQEPDTCVFT